MIDKNSGIITVGKETTIQPLSQEHQLMPFFTSHNAGAWDVKNGWMHYYLKNFSLEGKYFFFDFMFNDHILTRIDFAFFDHPVVNQTWDNWSEENERKKQLEFENWLTSEIGFERDFEWGKTSAYYDSKGGSSGIMIAYT